MKRAYAVIDTNIIVSALWTKNPESPTVKIINYVFEGIIVPVIHRKIIKEYNRVLRYEKFNFPEDKIETLVKAFKSNGSRKRPKHCEEKFPDKSDRIFYEVTLSARKKSDTRLVTGNFRHFPVMPFVVSAREMAEIVENIFAD